MNSPVVRLAIIGSDEHVNATSEPSRRIRGVEVVAADATLAAVLATGPSFDAVVAEHLDVALEAVAAKIPALVAAPLGDSLSAAEAILQRRREMDVVLAQSGLRRNAPAACLLAARLRAGKLGEPGLLRVHRWGSGGPCDVTTSIYGDIDLACHLFATAPTAVYAIRRRQNAYLQIHLGFAAGGMALLDFAHDLPVGQTYETLSLIGSQGAAYEDDHHNAHLLLAGGTPNALLSRSGNGYVDELRDFATHVAAAKKGGVGKETNRTVPAGSGDAEVQLTHRVTDAVRRSLELGKPLHESGGEYEPA